MTETNREKWGTLERLLIENFLHPDIEAVEIILAAMAAHYITDYPPAWLMPIAPSGSMKTVVIEGMAGLPTHGHR